MAEWRFLAYDLRTSAFVGELFAQSWRSVDELNEAGEWSATIALTDSGVAVVKDATRRGRSLIVAERDGVPAFSGIVWRRRYVAENRQLQIAGRGLLSYFDHWSQIAAVTYTTTDQLAIFRDFVTQVQGAPAGSIGLVLGAEASGVLRDRSYPSFAGKLFGELMRELAAVQNGFDFDMRVEYQAGAPVRQLRLWYPRRGRTTAVTGLSFRTGSAGNALLFEVDEDASDMAVTVLMLGAGDGADMLTTTQSRTDLIVAGWPGYRVTRARKDISELSTLNTVAAADAERLSGVDAERFTIQVDPESVGQPWGSWELGDDCTLIVEDDPFYPLQSDGSPGLALERRVVAHQWTISEGAEQLVLGLDRKVIP
jgi:hypothetical protein